jgi:hypothetical protein
MKPISLIVVSMRQFTVEEDILYIHDDQIESIEIPSNVRFLSPGCFQNCDKIREVVIPEGITKLQV